MEHSALKLEKSATSKVQKHIFCYFKMAKIQFLHQKKVKNCIFGSFKLFSGAKNDFLLFLKMQNMCSCTCEIALFSDFRAL